MQMEPMRTAVMNFNVHSMFEERSLQALAFVLLAAATFGAVRLLAWIIELLYVEWKHPRHDLEPFEVILVEQSRMPAKERTSRESLCRHLLCFDRNSRE